LNADYKSRGMLAALFSAALLLLVAPQRSSAQVSLRTVVEMAQRNSTAVRVEQADVQKAAAALSQSKDVFLPAIYFGSGLPAFPEVGYTGNLPTIWDASVQSLVFSMAQFRDIKAARLLLQSAQLNLKDVQEQVALDASNAYIELDTVNQELAAAHQQEDDATRLVAIEQQRAEAGVDPLSQLLQAKLTAAQIKLTRLHLESRAAILTKQLATLTGLPAASITPDHGSIPEIPAVSGDQPRRDTFAATAAKLQADSRYWIAKGDQEKTWTPQFSLGILYNRNTTLLNNVNQFFPEGHPIPANNLSSGISISLPIFDAAARAKARESAADALRSRVEAEQAQRQNEAQIVQLDTSLRELQTQAEIADLKQQISSEELKTVTTQIELGTGGGAGPGAPQLSPQAEQQARIDERQKYQDSLEAGLELGKTRLSLLRMLGHMQDWLNELQQTH
jgi:outer membrane protein TolC